MGHVQAAECSPASAATTASLVSPQGVRFLFNTTAYRMRTRRLRVDAQTAVATRLPHIRHDADERRYVSDANTSSPPETPVPI